jgi:segregation and condensation protein B
MNIVEQAEALLFVADSPVSLQQLSRALDATEGQTEQALEVLQQRLAERGALQVVRLAGGYQLSTKPEFSTLVGNFLKPQRGRLSRALLEVLAIVAYRQPITMATLDEIRGVQCDYSIRGLLDRGLIHEKGRVFAPGRPILYGTTKQFLHQFHLNDLDELPEVMGLDSIQVISTGEPQLFDPVSHEVH